ncbi:MAG: UvrD-helicase domain-containing protein [Bacteroidales bacterium]|nr:UvrD-helicase domain-containing protein [Bacteroidales bacterium]
MIKIVKASAGSGKTYNLAKEYITLLLTKGSRDAYKHILAVTFTNKATDEMKSRILQELYVLATNPAQSPYIDDLRRDTGRSETDIQKAVRETLSGILHDYGMFSVSTIDKFFQQTLRAFSREIGQFASYQLELDKDSLIQETVDRLLDSLEEGTPMFRWLVEDVREQIEENGRYNLQGGLIATANSLKSTEHQTMVERHGIDEKEAYSQKNLNAIRRICVEVMREFESTGDEKNPTKEYVTAKIIRNQLYGLGIAREFYEGFRALMSEKNVLYIDETNSILKDIISGTDTPFVYEKTGVRYENFLLDEFQDTSRVQWDNFYPLLKESDSSGHESYIVGDVKQSIYRWRNSDWNLLAKELKAAFPLAEESTLDTNFRSCRNIVAFNNAYFEFLAGILDRKSANRPADATPVSEIYRDVRQKCNKKQDGCVKMVFCPKEKGRDLILEEVLRAIGEVLESGGTYRDVAILVRTKAQGAKIASALIENKIPFITNDSLSVKSSTVVNKLVSLLSFIDNPDDTVTGYLAKPLGIRPPEEYHSLVDLCEYLLRGLLEADAEAVNRDVAYVRTFMDEVSTFASLNGNTIRGFLQHWETANPVISLPDSGNSVTIMTIHKAKGLDFPYVIYPYAGSEKMYSPDVHWCVPETDPESKLKDCKNLYQVKLSSSTAKSFFAGDYLDECYKQYVDDINVVYVAMTRAAKGLHVIAGSPSKKTVGASKNPYGFSDFGFLKDSLYLFAKTEAAGALGLREVFDCSEPVSMEALASGKLDASKNMVRFQIGDMPDFTREKKEASVVTLPASYPSWELNAGRARLAVGFDGVDFFAEDEASEDGSEDGSSAEASAASGKVSARVKGTVLHNLLASVTYPDDLDKTIDGALMDGILNEEEARAAREFLGKAIRSAVSRGWFSKDAAVRNETSIIDCDGAVWRPDRVEIHPDGSVVVIDYKFARPKPEYVAQVRRYAELWKRMGCRGVTAFLWYVYTDRVEQY